MALMVDILVNNLRNVFQRIPGPRAGSNIQYAFDDIDMERIPTDDHIRKQFDGIDCRSMYLEFDAAFGQLTQSQVRNFL